MSFLYKRLNALPPPQAGIEITYRLPLILADGDDLTDDPLAAADLGTMRTFFTASLDTRVTALETGGGTPSYWPTPRTISLTGPVVGSVALDGSADASMAVTVPAGALSISNVDTLAPTLVSMDSQLNDHEIRLVAAESAIGSSTAATADKWTTPRTLSLTGLAAGSILMDGSADVDLEVTVLTVTKADVGLGSVDNTADADKPISTAQQSALDAKAPLTGLGASGTWSISITGLAAKASILETARNFNITGVVTAAAVGFDGSGNVTLATTIADGALSIAKTAGLQTALDTKLDATATAAAATKFATARAFSLSGVVSTSAGVNFDGTGNVNLVTTMTDGALSIAKTAGLQGALDAKADAANAALTGTPTAPTAVVGTNTTQLATTAFVQAEIANDAPSKTGTGASGTWGISITGNAATATNATSAAAATKLATPRAFSLTGVVTAAGINFDGTGNVALATAIADGALSIAKTSGLQGVLDGKVDTADVSAVDLANTIVQRNTSADMVARLYRSTYADQTTISGAMAYRINNTTDTYIRFCNSPAAVANWLNLGTADTVSFSRVSCGYDSGQVNSVGCSNWFRSSGNTGWYSAAWGIGIYASDATYVRTYNGAQMAAADFVISSDRRLKTGIRDFQYNGRLRPVHYYHLENRKPDFGFIAQEVQAQYPEAVGVMGDSGMLQLSYPKLTAVLSYQVNQLEDEVKRMRKQLDQLLTARKPWWKRLLRR
jgi:hypothetical protein